MKLYLGDLDAIALAILSTESLFIVRKWSPDQFQGYIKNYCKGKGIEAKLVEKCSYFKVMAMAEAIYSLVQMIP